MTVEDIIEMKAGGLLPDDKELLPPALQIAAALPACQDPDTILRMLIDLDGPTVWEQTAQALGFYPEGGTSLMPVADRG